MFHLEGFHPVAALVAGALIGLAASVVLLFHGRVAGISGIVGGLLQPTPTDTHFRGWFLAGLFLAGLVGRVIAPDAFAHPAVAGLGITALAGLLVGFGTRLGNGCTSGHGVCGLSRLSTRSLVATLTFISTGAVTVFLARHAAGGVQ